MTTTINLQLDLPAHGSDVDTWDVPVNGNASIIDNCFGSTSSFALTNGFTLSVQQAQAATLRFSGVLTTDIALTVPLLKSWIIDNNCTNSNNACVVLQTPGGGNIIAVPPGISEVYSDGTDFKFKGLEPTGRQVWWEAQQLPRWVRLCTVQPYLIMDGSTFNTSTYAHLADFLATNVLPDYRGRAQFAMDNQGGTPAGRLTAATVSPDGNTLGASGGVQVYALTSGELAAHTHTAVSTVTDPGHFHTTNNIFASGVGSTAPAGSNLTTQNRDTTSSMTGISVETTVQNAGLNQAHNNMPPARLSLATIKT